MMKKNYRGGRWFNFTPVYIGVLISPQPDLLPDVFCLMVRIFRLMLNIYINSNNIPPIMIINRIYERQNILSLQLVSFPVGLRTYQHSSIVSFHGQNISFYASLVIYINITNIPPIMIINRIYEHQNLLSLQLFSFLVGLRTYQHPLYNIYDGLSDTWPGFLLCQCWV